MISGERVKSFGAHNYVSNSSFQRMALFQAVKRLIVVSAPARPGLFGVCYSACFCCGPAPPPPLPLLIKNKNVLDKELTIY